MGFSVTRNGREVRNPLARGAIIAGLSVSMIGVCLLVAIVLPVALAVLAVLAVAAVALHPILRATGRRGFITHKANGGTSITISAEGFRRA